MIIHNMALKIGHKNTWHRTLTPFAPFSAALCVFIERRLI